jgi:hypothetical protein
VDHAPRRAAALTYRFARVDGSPVLTVHVCAECDSAVAGVVELLAPECNVFITRYDGPVAL